MPKRFAFMPLSTFPEAIENEAILAALGVAACLGCEVNVTAYAADVPQIYTPMGDVAFDISSLIAGAQKASAEQAARLQALVTAAVSGPRFTYVPKTGGMYSAISTQARQYDLAVLPWQKGAASITDLAETLIFNSGRPLVLVPASAKAQPIEHLAVAWNNSGVAARALNDALPYLAQGGQITVLAAGREGDAGDLAPADDLAKALVRRGYLADARAVAAQGRGLADGLQRAALRAGAGMMVMGGFGHARLRDFVLGGATTGVFADLHLPVMVSH